MRLRKNVKKEILKIKIDPSVWERLDAIAKAEGITVQRLVVFFLKRFNKPPTKKA